VRGELDPATLFQALATARALVLAVSGGPDSTALMHLVAAWKPTMPVSVASVDHGLRERSRQDAEAVVARAGDLGLPGRVLTWAGEKPRRGLQAQARTARYALLDGYCREIGASHLVLAHTLDDQAETMLMRMAAGSGLRGLAGMRAMVAQGSVTRVRPLLAVRKGTLVALCQERHWPFLDDPANRDVRFARSRWRRLAPALAAEGLTPERLYRLAERVRRADAALDACAAQASRAVSLTGREAALGFDAAALLAFPDELVLRILGDALAGLSALPARLERLESLVDAVRSARSQGSGLRRSLQGCLVTLTDGGELLLAPEPPRRRGRTAGRRSLPGPASLS
jgi:tRNA(Ile)-lysidine synthase